MPAKCEEEDCSATVAPNLTTMLMIMTKLLRLIVKALFSVALVKPSPLHLLVVANSLEM